MIRKDLNMESRMIQNRPPLTEATRFHRLEKSRVLVNLLKSPVISGLVRIFSDEKLFHFHAQLKRMNIRYPSGQPVDEVDPRIRTP